MRYLVLGTALVFGACAPRLSQETIAHHPRIQVSTFEPKVVESSRPLRPSWVDTLPKDAVDWVPFSGQAMASSLEVAKAEAERDLYAAASSFVSVDVASSFESKETLEQKDGREHTRLEIAEVVQARTAAQLKEVHIDEFYWEKVQISPLFPEGTQFRWFALARVPKAEILRARLGRQAEREKRSGRRVVVVLPLRAAGAAVERRAAVEDVVAESLARRLLVLPGLHLSDPELVRALLAGERGKSEAQALEVIRDALLPDLVVAGSYQIHAGKLRVGWTVYGPSGPVEGGTVEVKEGDLFGLEDQLFEALRRPLAAERAEATPPKAPPAAPRGGAELEGYAEAGRLYAAGLLEQAEVQLRAVLGRQLDFGRAHLRLGRILERRGRYGDLDRRAPPTSGALQELRLCLSWRRITSLDPARYLETLEATPPAPRPRLGEQVDELLSAAAYGIQEGYQPEPEVGLPAASAAGAYWHAYRLGKSQADPALALEALVALADLALRVDRPESARILYTRARAEALGQGLLHLQALAALGLAKVDKAEGHLAQAEVGLREVLEVRRRLSEKPYVLEVLNELGGVLTELGAHPAATLVFSEARRIADELGDRYLGAVLDNNLGVLDAATGRRVRAKERYGRALITLTDLGEAEGRIAAGLNAGTLAAEGGELEAARLHLRNVEALVLETGQEGRHAQLLRAQGLVELIAGDTDRALVAWVKAWIKERDLGRTRSRLEIEALLVALGYEDQVRRGLSGYERAEQLGCLMEESDRLANAFGGLGLDVRAVPPFVARANALWLAGLAESDGYTTRAEWRRRFGGRW